MRGITHQSFKSYLPLIPWLVLAAVCGVAWAATRLLLLGPAEDHLSRVEAERVAVRHQVSRRQQAKETVKDLTRLLALLPTQRDFAELPQTISEQASHSGVILPSLTYSLEKPEGPARKALLKGPVTGRYEDLRRFIYNLESGNRLVFIEDLDVTRSVKSERDFQAREAITFRLQMSTYVRKNPASLPAGGPSVPAPQPQQQANAQ
jgi:Tfp pilus assembly protein PilO